MYATKMVLALVVAGAGIAALRAGTNAPPAAAGIEAGVAPTRENYLRMAGEVEKSLQEDDLKKFFPMTVDETGGGFFENYSRNWTHTGGGFASGRGRRGFGAGGAAPASSPAGEPAVSDPIRSVVYQSRLTWLAAQAAMRYPGQAAQYLQYAAHGARFLEEKQWDPRNGGFWWQVDDTGRPTGQGSKHVYGNSFAIYALATYYQASHDPAALAAAKKGFMWLEDHAHDAVNGGYYEQILGDDSRQQPGGGGGTDIVGAMPGQKSMNTHIHLLESLAAILEVWPDALVKKRAEEIYQIAVTKIYAEPGYLHMFFAADWTPIARQDSYGHDIETAYLLSDAAAALGKPDDPACWHAGRSIVDHCLKVGFDPENGGLNNEGTVDGSAPPDRTEIWWVQAEALNALLLMHGRYGKGDPRYWNAFVREWEFIEANQIDHTYGGWYNQLNADNTPDQRKIAKTDPWTEGYHQGRAMLSVIAALEALGGDKR